MRDIDDMAPRRRQHSDDGGENCSGRSLDDGLDDGRCAMPTSDGEGAEVGRVPSPDPESSEDSLAYDRKDGMTSPQRFRRSRSQSPSPTSPPPSPLTPGVETEGGGPSSSSSSSGEGLAGGQRRRRQNSLHGTISHHGHAVNAAMQSRQGMIRQGIASRDSFRRMMLADEKARRLEELGLTTEDVYSTDDEGEGDSSSSEAGSETSSEYLDLPEEGLLEEGQNYLAMSMLVYIYALLREMAVLGYTETDFRAIDVNRWVRWYEEDPPEDSEDDDESEDGTVGSASVRSMPRDYDESSVAQSSIGFLKRGSGGARRSYEKYLKNTRSAGSIIRCVLEELEREYQRAEQEDEDVGSRAGQHDISVIKEFQHWVDDSRCDQEDDAAEKAIKELQRQVAKKRWKRAVQAVMARSRFKFILAAAKAAREGEREEREGKKEEKTKEESVREKMERKKEAVRRQLEKEMKEGGGKGTNVNSWFTVQKRVIQSHFDDEADEDEAAKEENAKRRPHQSMIDNVVEQSLPSFFKPGSVLNLMMEQGIEVVYFGDRHPNEAIYCVCVCRPTRTVTVIFRGSVTAHNWMYNMKLMMTDQRNPLAREKYEGRSDFVKLHTGFGLYMLRRRRDTGQTKICEIFERIDRIGRELAPDGRYRVAVTGHSLGGALSTIFSFYAACDKRFTTLGPVRTFTFAAPRVGDENFRSAYNRLESTGRLRHARFSNIKDIVPLTPTFSVHGTRIGPWYKHVGLQVKLHETTGWGRLQIMKSVDASYPRDKSWTSECLRAMGHGSNFLFNLTTLKGFGRNHSLSEHQKRLNFLYQYRRQLLEADLRGDERRKMKSMEEYYRIKGGIGCAAIIEMPKGGGRGGAAKRAVIVLLVVSAAAVVAYVFVVMCPIGIDMRAKYCTGGGWKMICGGAVDIPSVDEEEGANVTSVIETEGPVDLQEDIVSTAAGTERMENVVEGALPDASEKSGDAGAGTTAEVENSIDNVTGVEEEATAAETEEEIEDVPVDKEEAECDAAEVEPAETEDEVENVTGAEGEATAAGTKDKIEDVSVVEEEGEGDATEEEPAEIGSSSVEVEGEGANVPAAKEGRDAASDELGENNSSTNTTGAKKGGAPIEGGQLPRDSSPVALPSSDSPVWGSRAHRRRVPAVLDQLPSARMHAESYAREVQREARLAARTGVVEVVVKEQMGSMTDPTQMTGVSTEVKEVEGFSNTPGRVLGPLLLHLAGIKHA